MYFYTLSYSYGARAFTAMVFILLLWVNSHMQHPALAQAAATATFTVDLEFARLQGGESLVILGSSATLGRWSGGDLRLRRTSGSLYAVTVSFAPEDIGQNLFYKFAILSRTGTIRFETRTGRALTLSAGHHDLPTVFFDDIDRPALANDRTLRLILDLKDFPGEAPSAVGIAGYRFPLTGNVPAALFPMHYDSAQKEWSADIPFEAGTMADIAFHIYLEVDGRWTREPAPHGHVVMIHNASGQPQASMAFSDGRIQPKHRSRALLQDDFAAVASATGDARYYLGAALERLEGGNTNRAQSFFNQFESGFLASASQAERDRWQDIFPIRYGQYLYQSGQTAQATSYLSGRESAAPESRRKAAYANALGAAQLASGDHANAIITFERVENTYADQSALRAAATFGRGVANIESGYYDQGTHLLETLDTSEEQKITALTVLGHAHLDSARFSPALETFETLTDLGTDPERIKARLLALDTEYRSGAIARALTRVDDLLATAGNTEQKQDRLRRSATNRHRKAHLLYLKGLLLDASGGDGSALFNEVATQYPDTRFASRAQRRSGN